MAAEVNFDKLIDVVETHASAYEAALIDLEVNATSTTGEGNPETISITDATVATTKVQVTQSLTAMAEGIAKNAADHIKTLGKKIQ